MTIHITLFFLQFLVGLLIGLYMSRNESRFSSTEVKFAAATIMFLISFILLSNMYNDIRVALLNIMSVILIIGGVVLGEFISDRLARRLLNRINNEKAHEEINRLVHECLKVPHSMNMDSDKVKIDMQLYATTTALRELAKSAKAFKREDLAGNIDRLSQLCVKLVMESMNVDTWEHAKVVRQKQIADKLNSVSTQVLKQAKADMSSEVMTSWNPVLFAVKASNIR